MFDYKTKQLYTCDVVFFFPRFEHHLQFALRIKIVSVKTSVVLLRLSIKFHNKAGESGKLNSFHHIKPVSIVLWTRCGETSICLFFDYDAYIS